MADWYRTGRKNPYTIYRMVGEQPSDQDVFVGSCRNATETLALVMAANKGVIELKKQQMTKGG